VVVEYTERTYRERVGGKGMTSFPLCVKESDLLICVDRESFRPELKEIARDLLSRCRESLERYIRRDPEFRWTLAPRPILPGAPRVARLMAAAARRSGVGPMAAVAGAVAEVVGRGLARYAREVIVENGGDIYLKTLQPRVVGIFAGKSLLSEKIGVRLGPCPQGWGICTSSATVGPSLSFGITDASVVLGTSAALADAAASTLGNLVHREEDISPALEKVLKIKGVRGAVVILGDKLGAMGAVELVPL